MCKKSRILENRLGITTQPAWCRRSVGLRAARKTASEKNRTGAWVRSENDKIGTNVAKRRSRVGRLAPPFYSVLIDI